jgi:hypothetical protein
MSPKIGRKIHLIMMAFWIIQLGVVWFLPAYARVPYLIFVSIYANIVGHWSGWSAERPSEVVEKGDNNE